MYRISRYQAFRGCNISGEAAGTTRRGNSSLLKQSLTRWSHWPWHSLHLMCCESLGNKPDWLKAVFELIIAALQVLFTIPNLSSVVIGLEQRAEFQPGLLPSGLQNCRTSNTIWYKLWLLFDWEWRRMKEEGWDGKFIRRARGQWERTAIALLYGVRIQSRLSPWTHSP